MGFSFEGKRVLITGGGGGVGSAIVQKFYESGATVYALDCSQPLLDELQKKFPNIIPVLADLRNWDEVGEIVKGLGPLDHLVNNAGVWATGLIPEVSQQELDRAFTINFKAPFNLSQVFAKNVIANSIQGATIVNVSSVGAMKACIGGSIYCCSKAALEMLTKCLTLELGGHGIRVNSILPTVMSTQLYAGIVSSDGMKDVVDGILSKTPMKGKLETADAANLVLYLSSPFSKLISGASVPIDGGLLVT